MTGVADYILLLHELDSGRIAIDGLPGDRTERISLIMRTLDTLRAIAVADAAPGSDGQAWVRYAKASFIDGWLADGDE